MSVMVQKPITNEKNKNTATATTNKKNITLSTIKIYNQKITDFVDQAVYSILSYQLVSLRYQLASLHHHSTRYRVILLVF